MKRRIAFLLVVTMVASLLVVGTPVLADEMTFLNTPRSETLIVEADAGKYNNPGWFNPYVDGVDKSFGMQQFTMSYLWDQNTMTGERINGLAAEPAIPNEDFTEWTIKLREGIKWSDGEDFNADDVVFTMNMILKSSQISCSATFNSYYSKIEKISDYEVKVYCNEPFTRLMDHLGVAVWGGDFNIVPEHVWSALEDPTTYKMDTGSPCSGPYTLTSYDELGTWALYTRREDWQNTDVGQLYGEPGPKYIIIEYIGNSETRTMAAINNEVDCMVEVTYEMLEAMTAQNPSWKFWYNDFPYALLDDTSAKGLAFNHAKAPFNNYYFRWGCALSIDLTEVAMSIFSGVGRSNAMAIDAVQLIQDSYYIPMLDWLKDFTIEGTDYKPFDATYKDRMAEKLTAMGYSIPTDEAALTTMFGVGWWKYDPEMAKTLFEKAGLELKDGVWYFEGEPFKFTVTCCTEGSGVQASRSGQSAVDQWKKFGFDCEVEYTQDQYSLYRLGQFDMITVWQCNGVTADLYNQIVQYDKMYGDVEIGTSTPLNGARWVNDEATEIIRKVAQIDGFSDEAHELYEQYLKIATGDMQYLGFFSGIKFVPYNSQYWTGFPNAEEPYDGPYWWWSCFKFALPKIQPAAN